MRSETTFGERLRRARREAGLSQSELETRSGIPKARLSRYENGHVLPSIATLGKLARALGISEATLLGDQRAIVDEFFNVLFARGVVMQSVEQARAVAGAVADIYDALGLAVTERLGSADPTVKLGGAEGSVKIATMAEVTDPGSVDPQEELPSPA
jgi:transcriptional regulator with XRE-family HTH domain